MDDLGATPNLGRPPVIRHPENHHGHHRLHLHLRVVLPEQVADGDRLPLEPNWGWKNLGKTWGNDGENHGENMGKTVGKTMGTIWWSKSPNIWF